MSAAKLAADGQGPNGGAESPPAIRLHLRFFASVAESLGQRERDISVPAGSTPRQVFLRLADEQPALARLADYVSFARNQEFVPADTPLCDADELAFIPPVSGGA